MNKIVIAIVVIAVLVGGYFFLGNKDVKEEPVVETQETTEVITEEIPAENIPVEEEIPEVVEEGGNVVETNEVKTDNETTNEEKTPAEDDLLVQ